MLLLLAVFESNYATRETSFELEHTTLFELLCSNRPCKKIDYLLVPIEINGMSRYSVIMQDVAFKVIESFLICTR